MAHRPTYYTDLTDAEWATVRAAVFPNHPDPDGLRPVLDGILYRVRAMVPWALLPTGFPPTDLLQATWAAWQADGTWAVLDPLTRSFIRPRTGARRGMLFRRAGRRAARLIRPLPGGPLVIRAGGALARATRWLARPLVKPLRPLLEPTYDPEFGELTLRRRVARSIRKLPGGPYLLIPPRTAIQTVQWVRSFFFEEACLPRLFRRANTLTNRKEYAAAAELYSRILAIDPLNLPTRLARLRNYHSLGRHAEVAAESPVILALPENTPVSLAETHAIMARACLHAGELDRAVAHAAVGRMHLSGGEYVNPDRLDPDDHPDGFEDRVTVIQDLAEYAINSRADFATANELYRRAAGERERYADWLAAGNHRRTLFLSDDWTRNIGHMALLDFWVKLDRLGWKPWDRMVLVAPPGTTANRAYAGYMRKFYEIQGRATPPGSGHMSAAFGPRVASLLDLPDGTVRYFTEGMGVIQEAWEREGRGPLLKLTPEDVAFGRRELKKMGVPDGAWFVSLHVRSAGFHKEGTITDQAHRNAEIGTYQAAAAEIVRRGGWVIRMGDKTMPPFPRTPGVIDYARGSHKSHRMDVFLVGGCRFFVGVASGISHLPTTFGVPCVLTNWLSNALPVYSRRDLFLPKLLRTGGQDLTFADYFDPRTRLLSYSGAKLADAGYEVVDNTSDELLGVVTEMLDQLDGSARRTADDEARLAVFDRLARSFGLAGFSRIGRDFLARHDGLLPGRGHHRRAA